MEKTWMIKDKNETYSEDEIIEMIKQNIISKDTYITNKEIDIWFEVKESIYKFYLKGENNENI